MADRLLLKPQGLGARGGRSKGPLKQSRRSAAREHALQPKGEILLKICCRSGAVDGRPNFLLRLLAARGAGSVCSSDRTSRLATLSR